MLASAPVLWQKGGNRRKRKEISPPRKERRERAKSHSPAAVAPRDTPRVHPACPAAALPLNVQLSPRKKVSKQVIQQIPNSHGALVLVDLARSRACRRTCCVSPTFGTRYVSAERGMYVCMKASYLEDGVVWWPIARWLLERGWCVGCVCGPTAGAVGRVRCRRRNRVVRGRDVAAAVRQ